MTTSPQTRELAIQTDPYQPPTREIEKIIEVPIEIPVYNAPSTPRLMARPMPIQLQLVKVLKEETVDGVLDRLAEALERDLGRIEEYVGRVVGKLVRVPGLGQELGKAIEKSPQLQDLLHIRIDQASTQKSHDTIQRAKSNFLNHLDVSQIPLQRQRSNQLSYPQTIIEVPVEVPVELTRNLVVEQAVELTRVVEVPVQVIKAVEVPVEIHHVVQEVVEVEVERTRVVETPVEVERVVERVVEKVVEKMVEKEVERQRIVETPVEIERVVETLVEVPVDRLVDRLVEVPVDRVVEVKVEVPVDRIVEVPVDRIVQVPVDRIVEVPVDRIVEKQVQKFITVQKIVQKPVQRIVEKIVQRIVQVQKPQKPTITTTTQKQLQQHSSELQQQKPTNQPAPSSSSNTSQKHHTQARCPRLDDSSIEQTKTVGVFSQLQHFQQTLQKHQQDLNKRYQQFKSQSKQQNQALKFSMLGLQDQIDRLTQQLLRHRQYASKLEQENAAIRNSLESKEVKEEVKQLKRELERMEEERRQMELQMGVIKVENEVLKGRLEETMEELQEVRMHGVELLEQFDSRAVEEVQHDIDDIKQWQRHVDQLTAEKQSLKSLIGQALCKSKSLQQRSTLLQSQLHQYKSISKLAEEQTRLLTSKLHQASKDLEQQQSVIAKLRSDKQTLKKSLEEVCSDNQKLKEIDPNVYEQLLEENMRQGECLREYRQEVEYLTETIENYKELLLRGDEIVGELCGGEMNEEGQQGMVVPEASLQPDNDILYRETMIKLKSRQTYVVEEGKGLNRMVHEENKQLLKEMYELCERNAQMSSKLEVLEKENQMLRGKMHKSSTSIDFKAQQNSKQKSFERPSNKQPQPQQPQQHKNTIKRQKFDKSLVQQLTDELDEQRTANTHLRRQISKLNRQLLLCQGQLAELQHQDSSLFQPLFKSHTQRRYNRDNLNRNTNTNTNTSIIDCCRLAEQLCSKLNEVNGRRSPELRMHLDRLINSANDASVRNKQSTTMDNSMSNLSQLRLSIKQMRDRNFGYSSGIQQQTQRSQLTRTNHIHHSTTHLPKLLPLDRSFTSEVLLPTPMPTTNNFFPSTTELTFENFIKVFPGTREWIFTVMLRLTEAVDSRLAETGSYAALHPREVAVYNWQQSDPMSLVVVVRDQQLFERPMGLYLAPEVLAGQPQTQQSLAWNLGVIFDYLVHGEMCWRSKAELMDPRNHFRFRDEEQPAEVKRLIEKLVQRNPQQRLGLCQLLVNIKYELKKK